MKTWHIEHLPCCLSTAKSTYATGPSLFALVCGRDGRTSDCPRCGARTYCRPRQPAAASASWKHSCRCGCLSAATAASPPRRRPTPCWIWRAMRWAKWMALAARCVSTAWACAAMCAWWPISRPSPSSCPPSCKALWPSTRKCRCISRKNQQRNCLGRGAETRPTLAS